MCADKKKKNKITLTKKCFVLITIKRIINFQISFLLDKKFKIEIKIS